MIKLTNLNKFFNKGKENEIHVINNTSLEFPNKGLISLLGESGSGKTTLLNVIGGLDKTDGEINFKDQTIKSYKSNVWDNIRVNNIGYIFQNYYLLEDRTVYDNIKIVLNLMGINDAEEIDYRITYTLDKVGMLRFKNRLASDLSGGQKQRVAIARAIVKNPDLIIADEPTGNLDTNNSIEVLKIIKEISKEKLVLLVTHNKDLANAYSDRIINIVDGKISSDIENIKSDSTLKYIDSNLYLKDLNHLSNKNINIYSNTNVDDLEFTIVKVNNNFYLKTNDKNVTVKVINDNSDIRLIDDKSENFKERLISETDFNLNDLEALNKTRDKKQIYTFKDSLIEAFKKITNLTRKGKLQIAVLILLGTSFVSGLFMFTSAIFIDTTTINFEKNVYASDHGVTSSKDDLPDDALIFDNFRVELTKGNFRQFIYSVNVAPKELINKENTSPDVVYIDSSLLDKNNGYSHYFNAFGIYTKEHLKNQKIYLDFEEELLIEGTVNTGTKTIYVDSKLLENLVLQSRHYGRIATDDIVFSTENITQFENSGNIEIYLPISYQGNEEEYYEDYLYSSNYKVVGYYNDNFQEDFGLFYITRDNFVKLIMEESYFRFFFHTKSKDVSEIFYNVYDYKLNELKTNKAIGLTTSIIQAVINLLIGLLLFYFLVRSGLTNRKKEISVLRSLGISKGEIRKLFATEYLLLTTFTSLIGVIIGNLIMYKISGSALSSIIEIKASPITTIISILLIYFVNITISLIPVNNILRKTPAQLLTSYDI